MTAADIRRIARAALGALFCALLALPLPAQTLEEVAARDPLSSATLFDPSAVPEPEAPAAVVLPSGDVQVSFGGLRVFFINVGQGDATYFELPDGSNALIDGGPTISALRRFLTERGVQRLSHVVLTHPHSDHYNGLKYAFDSLQVDHFYDTRMDNSSASGDETVRAKAAAELGCTTAYPAPGDALSWSAGVQVRVLSSCPSPVRSGGDGSSVNNCSIVLKIAYGGNSLLLTGDAETEVEARLVSQYGTALHAQVLKVGHHGSARSSTKEFLAFVRPQRAYISVGKNSYGHPTTDALTRLAAVGAQVLRTDQNGTLVWDPSTGSNFLSAAFPSKN
ncbi:MAG: ComEC/Rec2 family competence protein [Elusimicrobiota bacterium]|jgi:beta-lactamase superfamily II metal-dependent hydrolase